MKTNAPTSPQHPVLTASLGLPRERTLFSPTSCAHGDRIAGRETRRCILVPPVLADGERETHRHQNPIFLPFCDAARHMRPDLLATYASANQANAAYPHTTSFAHTLGETISDTMQLTGSERFHSIAGSAMAIPFGRKYMVSKGEAFGLGPGDFANHNWCGWDDCCHPTYWRPVDAAHPDPEITRRWLGLLQHLLRQQSYGLEDSASYEIRETRRRINGKVHPETWGPVDAVGVDYLAGIRTPTRGPVDATIRGLYLLRFFQDVQFFETAQQARIAYTNLIALLDAVKARTVVTVVFDQDELKRPWIAMILNSWRIRMVNAPVGHQVAPGGNLRLMYGLDPVILDPSFRTYAGRCYDEVYPPGFVRSNSGPEQRPPVYVYPWVMPHTELARLGTGAWIMEEYRARSEETHARLCAAAPNDYALVDDPLSFEAHRLATWNPDVWRMSFACLGMDHRRFFQVAHDMGLPCGMTSYIRSMVDRKMMDLPADLVEHPEWNA